MTEILIIGKGPAGISLAIYLKRAGFNPVVVGKDFGALEDSDKVENYYGFPKAVKGKALVEKGIKQAQNLGIEVITDEVLDIIDMSAYFEVTLLDKKIEAKAVALALGKKRESLKVKGFEEFVGKGISFCATCDGFFFRNKKIAVIGSQDYAFKEYMELKRFTKDIVLFTNGEEINMHNQDLLKEEEITINQEKIIAFNGEERLKSIVTENNEYDVSGVFVALKTAGPVAFAKKLGIILKNEYLLVDENYMTNIKGIFALGDCIGGTFQIAKAVNDGMASARGIREYLKNKGE